jgi:hypothetical protein
MLGLNTTASEPCEMGSFCSLEEEAGELVMLVEAEVLDARPVTYFDLGQSGFVYGEYEQHSTGTAAFFLRNMVGPDGLRPEVTLVPAADEFADPKLPRYNDPRNYIPLLTNWYPAINARNDLRVDHGTYHLTVRRLQFEEGGLMQGEVRPGCASFGQWRYFHIRTRGANEATVSLHLQTSHGVSGLFLRQGARPTVDIHDGRAGAPHPLWPERRTPCGQSAAPLVARAPHPLWPERLDRPAPRTPPAPPCRPSPRLLPAAPPRPHPLPPTPPTPPPLPAAPAPAALAPATPAAPELCRRAGGRQRATPERQCV